MGKVGKTYHLSQIASAVLMIVMLLWLTISAPFVYAGQQEQNKKAHVAMPGDNNEEEPAIPLTNTTEEKKPGVGNSLAEEFLCSYYEEEHSSSLKKNYKRCEKLSSYTAFHGKLICPPPDAGEIVS